MQLAISKAPTFALSTVCRPAAFSAPRGVRFSVRHAAALIKPASSRSLVVRAAAQTENGTKADAQVVVKIDNESDPFATVVTVEFGDYLGELVDTVAALKNLGLNIKRARLTQRADKGVSKGKHKFYVTDAAKSEKVVKSTKIEEIRLTILNMMLQYHPESSEQIAWATVGRANDLDPTRPLGNKNKTRSISTQIEIREHESGSHSELLVSTLDRPGLLTDIVKVLKDVSLNVVSAEVDTVGKNAFDKFNITYHGEALPEPMCQLAVNALQYYLSMAEVEKEWSESY